MINISLFSCGDTKVPGIEDDIKESKRKMDSTNEARRKDFLSTYPPSKSIFIKCVIGDTIQNLGTAFMVSYKGKMYLITNYHVLTGKDINGILKNPAPENIRLDTKSNEDGGDLRLQFSAKALWLEYIDKESGLLDIAILELPSIPANTYIYNIDSNLIKPMSGDSCFIVGFPKSYAESKENNRHPKPIGVTISINNKYSEILKNGYLVNWYNKIENGTSGSPVLSKSGNLLGLYAIKYSLDKSEYGFFYSVEMIQKAIQGCKPLDWSKI
jgi:Trypsin-like peptidase domain